MSKEVVTKSPKKVVATPELKGDLDAIRRELATLEKRYDRLHAKLEPMAKKAGVSISPARDTFQGMIFQMDD